MKERDFETTRDMADKAEYTDFLIVEGDIFPEDEMPNEVVDDLPEIGCMRPIAMIDLSVKSGDAIDDLLAVL